MNQCGPAQFKGWFHLPLSPHHRTPDILTWEPTGEATLELVKPSFAVPLAETS